MMRAPVVDRLSATTRMQLSIGLPLRDPGALATTIEAITDPASPSFGHPLTPDEFADRFGASRSDYQRVVDWARARHLAVTPYRNRLVLAIEGAAADVEAAFHVRILVAQRPDGTTFHMPDAEPSLDLDIPVEHIGNLDDYVVPQPVAGSGSNGFYQGADFRNAYVACTTLTGAGQTIGILGLQGFSQSDVNGYFQSMSLPLPAAVQTDPANSDPTPGLEGTLDPEIALSMAPGAQVVVFTGSALDTILANMTERTDVRQFSSSYAPTLDSTGQNLLAQLVAQGQWLFQGSGDSGGWTAGNAPASNDIRFVPTITVVGGTALDMNGNGASYGTESAWSCSAGNTACSGGGTVPGVSLPSYQVGLANAANGGSMSNRNVPDISAEAANVNVYFNGASQPGSGTSVSAPLMAGFMALVNELRANDGQAPVQASNATLYALAKSNPTTTFNDITVGSNGPFSATTGYDLVTGLGSPQCGLIQALAGEAPPPNCVVSQSCANIISAPPDLIVTCPTAVDFYRQYPAGERVSLGTSTTITDQMSDYNDFLVACGAGTSNCTLYSEYSPVTSWCPGGSSSGGGGTPCRGKNCCIGTCQ